MALSSTLCQRQRFDCRLNQNEMHKGDKEMTSMNEFNADLVLGSGYGRQVFFPSGKVYIYPSKSKTTKWVLNTMKKWLEANDGSHLIGGLKIIHSSDAVEYSIK